MRLIIRSASTWFIRNPDFMIFDTREQYILEDDFVLLRRLKTEDLDDLAGLSGETDTWKFSTIPVTDKESLGKYIQLALENHESGKEYPFVVYDKKAGKYAGSTRFYDIQLPNKMLQLGYTWYGKDFQGTGLNKHCKYLLLQFAFETIGMERVEFRANNKNERSIAAMKSIGCTVEGILRSNITNPDNSRRDTIVLSILKEEWLGKLKAKLEARL